MDSSMTKDVFVLECKSQGIEKTEMSMEELTAWIDEEISFWPTLTGIDGNLLLYNTNFGSPQIVQNYRTLLSSVKTRLQNKDLSALKDLLKKANDLRAILAHGTIGGQLRDLVDQKDIAVAQRLTLVMSTGVVEVREEVRRELAPLTALLKYNPFILTTADIVSAKSALARSETIEKKMTIARENFEAALEDHLAKIDDFSATKVKELNELHTQYESYLILQGPSRHWKRVAETSWLYAAGAFGVFVLMLALPAVAVAVKWTAFSSYIDHVVDISKGGISLAAVVVFTIPVLAYGWLLKHISRVFTQNLAINADAEHRRVMAITFLGLARRKSIAMQEQDRALILNALFRPSPTNPQDDGPPSGLLELLKK